MLKNKPFWISIALLAAYLLAGYFAGPHFVQPRLEHYVAEHFGRELQFEQLRINPITWSVQLQTVNLPSSEQGLWPGLAMSAERIDMRFSFWRLAPVIAELKLQAPGFILDTESRLMQSGRYPFISLWRQWQLRERGDSGPESVAIRNWRVDSGKVLMGMPNTPAADRMVLGDISLQANKPNPEGIREFDLAFSVTDRADIQFQGLFHAEELTASGLYQVETAAAAGIAGIQVEGIFSSHLLADEVQIDLYQSQLHGGSVSACMLEGLMCSSISPLKADFEASLLAASDGIRLLHGNAQLSTFQLDASLGRGSAELARQRVFDRAEMDLSLPQTPLSDGTDKIGIRNFVVKLFAADSGQYLIDGQVDFMSQLTQAQFQVNGQQEFSGALQAQRFGPQLTQSAYSQLTVQLDNPGADLIQNFAAGHLDNRIEAKDFRLQLTARMDDQTLALQETIRMEHPRLVAHSKPAHGVDGEGSFVGLDAEWLLALLQDSDGLIYFEVPQVEIDSAKPIGLQEIVERQTFLALKAMSEQPFESLATALQIGDRNLDEICFAAGSAALDIASKEMLDDLATILLQRPGLGLALAGVYDPLIDKKALQTEQVRTHIALATAADLSFRSGSAPTDFSDPKVHSVIDEFARRRLPAKVMQSFSEHFGLADVDQGVLPEGEVSAYYEILFELLVDYADIPQGAMTTLARYRAQAVMDGLEEQGVARERLQATAQPIISTARVDGVPLPLQLTVWTETHAALSAPLATESLSDDDKDSVF